MRYWQVYPDRDSGDPERFTSRPSVVNLGSIVACVGIAQNRLITLPHSAVKPFIAHAFPSATGFTHSVEATTILRNTVKASQVLSEVTLAIIMPDVFLF